jgi:hypothetical protein
MTFKEYSNPLYDVVDNEESWTSGLCCIFANALRERYEIPMRAVLIKSQRDGCKTLVHAFGALPGGRIVDALGVRNEDQLLSEDYADFSDKDWRDLHCARPGEKLDIVIEDVTLGHLWSLNPEDHEATNAAHEYIEAHPELFQEVEMIAHEGAPSRKSGPQPF